MSPTPQFEHDCSACVLLGVDKEYDYYFCSATLPTVVARYGSAWEDYTSMFVLAGIMEAIEEKFGATSTGHPLLTCHKLAVEQGHTK